MSVSLATPSVSPTPDGPKRQYPTPGVRPDGQPKRPMNAFILFSNEMRSKLADSNPHLSNAAVSVLLGQRWREMQANEKSGYVTAAKKIKEDFHIQHPDAKTRCVSRKAKRAKLEEAGSSGGRGKPNLQPSLQALAMVGSRLNQSGFAAQPYHRSDSASTSTYTQDRDAPSRRSYEEDEDMDDEEDDEEGYYHDDDDVASQWEGAEASAPSSDAPWSHQPSLLEQLCTVAENEHANAAKMLSALGAC